MKFHAMLRALALSPPYDCSMHPDADAASLFYNVARLSTGTGEHARVRLRVRVCLHVCVWCVFVNACASAVYVCMRAGLCARSACVRAC